MKACLRHKARERERDRERHTRGHMQIPVYVHRHSIYLTKREKSNCTRGLFLPERRGAREKLPTAFVFNRHGLLSAHRKIPRLTNLSLTTSVSKQSDQATGGSLSTFVSKQQSRFTPLQPHKHLHFTATVADQDSGSGFPILKRYINCKTVERPARRMLNLKITPKFAVNFWGSSIDILLHNDNWY